MGPLATILWQRGDARTRQQLASSQHFIVPADMMTVAHLIGSAEPAGVYDARLPAAATWVETEWSPGRPLGYLLEQDGDEVFVSQFAPYPDRIVSLLRYSRGADHFYVSRHPQAPSRGVQQQGAIASRLLDALMGLILEPRLVIYTPASRQRRRLAARAIPAAAEVRWGDIKWTVGGSVISHGSGEVGAGSTRALHYSRAHWRHYDHETPRAETRSGLPGWWVFVAGSWKGHPSNGIRLRRHKPELGAESYEVVRWHAIRSGQITA